MSCTRPARRPRRLQTWVALLGHGRTLEKLDKLRRVLFAVAIWMRGGNLGAVFLLPFAGRPSPITAGPVLDSSQTPLWGPSPHSQTAFSSSSIACSLIQHTLVQPYTRRHTQHTQPESCAALLRAAKAAPLSTRGRFCSPHALAWAPGCTPNPQQSISLFSPPQAHQTRTL